MFSVSPIAGAVIAGVFGLLVGSFLNVVVHRLPLMMARDWWREVADLLTDTVAHEKTFGKPLPQSANAEGQRVDAALESLGPLSLSRPRSRCPHCGHRIAWYENIPVLSWLVLRGRCSECKARISARYPIVELVTAAAFAVIAARFGITWQAGAWAVFTCILIAQFLIDFDTQLLPDTLNYVLLWLGLIASAVGWTVPLPTAVWGAVLGYLVFWTVSQLYGLLKGRPGMGNGDFKLLAALGAWFGAHYLVALILLSSVVGSIVGGMLLLVGRLSHRDIPIPFGPFIAGAGLVAFFAGPQQLQDWIPFAFPL